MTRTGLRVNLAERAYEIAVTHGDPAGLGPFARQRSRGQQAFLVTDHNVEPLALQARKSLDDVGFRTALHVLPPGEGQKALAVASQLYDALVELQADRKTLVVAVGGGVIGDLAGFVAATFNRGLPLLMVPTTLLAMVDSSVGGKVAVNHPKAKNLIGAFHQPVGVWIDIAALDRLPDRDFRSGLAEVVKYGVILDPDFFVYLEEHAEEILARSPAALQHIVTRSCQLKAQVVEQDEREETGLRAVLNYGHTFAHAFESAAGYGSWQHGEAVAAGMICASRLAERRGLIPTSLTERQIRLLQKFRLPVAPEPWPIADQIRTMRSDKKAEGGRLRFILPERLGKVSLFADVPEADVEAVLGSFHS